MNSSSTSLNILNLSSSSSSERKKIALLGDSGETPLGNTEAVANRIKQNNPNYIIHLGDANYGNVSNLQNYFLDFWQNYLDKIYFVFGNHDLDYDYGASIIDNLPLVKSNLTLSQISNKFLCYDFIIENIHFFVMQA